MKQRKARILFYDIETTPMLTYAWRRYDDNAAKVKRDTELLSFAWRWAGERKVHCVIRPDYSPGSERGITEKLHSLLDEADVVVAHNGINFDNKKSRAFFAKFKMTSPSFHHTVDTCQVAKQHFGFTSNKLDDLGEYLELGRKVKHEGIDLWDKCMQDDPLARKRMVRYNKRDVVLLQKVYKRLLSYMVNHPNLSLIQGGMKDVNGCPNCGSSKYLAYTGYRCTQRQAFKEVRCLTQKGAHARGWGKKNRLRGCGRVFKVPLTAALPRGD